MPCTVDKISEPSGLSRLEELFHQALELTGAERSGFLAGVRRRDAQLGRALEELLAAEAEPDNRLTAEGDREGAVWEELVREGATGPGDRVGPFRLLEKLGEGGMASVWWAVRETEDFRQEVAVKLLRPGLVTEEGLARFDRERRIVARLDHPHIAKLVDGGVTETGQPWFALELVHGRPIDRYCDEERLAIGERIRLVIDVGWALHYAHQNLVVHRDLKPTNVVVDGTGRVRLLDFGIAKQLDDEAAAGRLTRSGSMPMTPIYSAPEQLAGEPVTTASDQYQLGLLLFELVTGQCHHLLDGTDSASIHRRARELPSPRPSRVVEDGTTTLGGRAPARDWPEVAAARRSTVEQLARRLRGDLDTVILKALEKDPDRRYASVAGLVEDLERFLDGRPIEARTPSLAYRARRLVGRHRALTALAATLAVVLVTWTAWAATTTRRERIVREFSQRVEREAIEIEQLLEGAALQPLHDTSAERELARLRLDRIAELGRERPRLLGPAASYATGRGLLALGDFDGAVERLERAWAGGFRGEGIRWALGMAALARLYEHRLDLTRSDPTQRALALAPEEAAIRDRALEHLASVGSTLDARAGLATALTAFYQGDLEAALAGEREVRNAFPWEAEALILEGRILVHRAEESMQEGRVGSARGDLARAGEAFAEALAVRRSDAELWLDECRRLEIALHLETLSRDDFEPWLREAEAACGNAAAIRPDWVEPHLQLSNALVIAWDRTRWAAPGAEYAGRMRAAAERALGLDPGRSEPHHRLGLVGYFEGYQLYRRGEDPGEAVHRGREAFERAVELAPEYPYSYNGLALVDLVTARWGLLVGADPAEPLERARANAERTIERVPLFHNARSNLSTAWLLEGRRRLLFGGDPVPALQRAVEEIDRILDVNPDFTHAWYLKAWTLWWLGGTLADLGLPVTPVLPELDASLEEAGRRRPPDVSDLAVTAGRNLLTDWDRFEAGEPPVLLATTRDLLARARQGTGGQDHLIATPLALDVELLDLRARVAAGQSPAAWPAAVGHALADLDALATHDSQMDRLAAEAWRVRAAWHLARGEDPRRAAERSLELSARGLERNPALWGLALERAAARAVTAAWTGDAAAPEAIEADLLPLLVGHGAQRTGLLLAVVRGLADGSLERREAGRRILALRGTFPAR
jgi:serine/threonine protein kinase/tetratricopeptide (TPR) repeat protein